MRAGLPGSKALGPDLLSGECDHVQGPIHEASVQHLGAALAYHCVAGPVVGSDVLAGRNWHEPAARCWGCQRS